MRINHLMKLLKKQQQNNVDFYTPTGIHVYFKDPIDNDVDVETVVAKLEARLPIHLLSEIEMIIVGWVEEFEKRSANAFYDSGTIYVTNLQDNEEDLYDDLIHEISHSLEEKYGYQIYSDNKIANEFLEKRQRLYDILWAKGFKTPKSFFMNTEFDQDFDDFLYKDIGYAKLSPMMQGLFISAYAATSIREYFATMFTEYYLDPNHSFIKKVSPAVYDKIILLQDPEKLDF